MNMIIIIICIIISGSNIYSQTNKGDFTLAGNGYLQFPKNNQWGFSFSPNVGIFIVDNLVLFSGIGVYMNFNKNYRDLFYSMSSTIRYYFPFSKDRLKYFVNTGIGVSHIRNSLMGELIDKRNRLYINASVGINYFITNTIAIEGAFPISYDESGLQFDNRVTMGLRIFYQRSKDEK